LLSSKLSLYSVACIKIALSSEMRSASLSCSRA
jgi:hypothetical protein